ncbi:MarR family winged helix-turn-helix transcriptional regulator [Sulfuracidifex tepidarius]|nr:MarR family transcriptional regulator [Sulfuracidifex tepidarius]
MENWELILRGFRDLRRLLQREAEQVGVSVTEVQILYQIIDGPKKMGEIADMVGISKSSTTELIDKMESKGLLERGRGEDKRIVFVKITEKGISTLNETRARYKFLIEQILKEVKEDEVLIFFKKVEEILDSPPRSSSR